MIFRKIRKFPKNGFWIFLNMLYVRYSWILRGLANVSRTFFLTFARSFRGPRLLSALSGRVLKSPNQPVESNIETAIFEKSVPPKFVSALRKSIIAHYNQVYV